MIQEPSIISKKQTRMIHLPRILYIYIYSFVVVTGTHESGLPTVPLCCPTYHITTVAHGHMDMSRLQTILPPRFATRCLQLHWH